jgi:hypothetical protein
MDVLYLTDQITILFTEPVDEPTREVIASAFGLPKAHYFH